MKLYPVLALLLTATVAKAYSGQENSIAEFLKARILSKAPGITINSVKPSAYQGLYEVVSDGQIYYISRDGNHLIDGELISLASQSNLTRQRRRALHLAIVEQLGERDMLIYKPVTDSGRTITVFTDIACPYCRKLHTELLSLLDSGIRLRYLFYPRAGLDSPAAGDLESVWCAANPQQAMTRAKAGEKISQARCDNPLRRHFDVAAKLNLKGTPVLYLDSGKVVEGYKEAAELLQMITNSRPLTF